MPEHATTLAHRPRSRIPHPTHPSSTRNRRRGEETPNLRPDPARKRKQQLVAYITTNRRKRHGSQRSNELRNRTGRSRRDDQIRHLEPGLQHPDNSRGRPQDSMVGPPRSSPGHRIRRRWPNWHLRTEQPRHPAERCGDSQHRCWEERLPLRRRNTGPVIEEGRFQI